MSPFYDDLIYVGLLVLSAWLGPLTRPGGRHHRGLSTLFGLAMVWAVSGVHALHCVFSVLLQIVLFRVWPHPARAWPWLPLHWVSFGAHFTYLFLFRLAFSPPAHTNAIQMILTLKLVGLAFERHDTLVGAARDSRQSDDEKALVSRFHHVNPSARDVVHYAFTHAGVLTGPYFKFRTYQDLCSNPSINGSVCQKAMWKRMSRIPLYVGLFFLSGYLFPIQAVQDDTFYANTSWLYRVAYMTPVFFNFRMRLYTGFVLSECSCIMAGLGAYPARSEPKPGQGPAKLEVLRQITDAKAGASSIDDDDDEPYNFETVHNIDEHAAEFVSTMREALKSWNMTVQWWLAVHVYRRLPFSKTVRTAAVMIVSSMWHGVHSGYYLSLGSVPIVLVVEDLYQRMAKKYLGERNQARFNWVSWFVRMQYFSYLGMAFQLLRIDSTMTFWHSIGYIGHTLLPILYIFGLFVVAPLLKQLNPIREDVTKESDKKE